ncbi:MAG: hypothetical protein M3R12_12915 [Actinomycetota bacterium]|nr:hypothetical protein [Actinomycetota bacterium]
MQADEALKLDYEQTTTLVREFTDLRTKMLAFVPTITGTAVGLLGEPRPVAELLGIALLGLVATLGIFVYELRNAELYDAAVRRAKELERQLGFPTVHGLQGAGGVLAAPPGRWFAHDRGWAFVYSAAVAGWSYLAAWGFLRWMLIDSAQTIAAVTGIAVGFLVAIAVIRFKLLP